MTDKTIYRTEPMATRALAAEIRHDHRVFVDFLEKQSGTSFGEFRAVGCEVKHAADVKGAASVRIDVELTFDRSCVGIEAKLDHELTPEQVESQLAVLGTSGTLFVLVPNKESAPGWLARYATVTLLGWEEVLECFEDPRLLMTDIEGEGRLMKTTVESWLAALGLEERLRGWDVAVRRGDSGMPSVVYRSAALPDGKTLRGQIQVAGRRMPGSLELVRFNSHIGISVDAESDLDFPGKGDSVEAPAWIQHLRLVHATCLGDEHPDFPLSRSAPRASAKGRASRKLELVNEHLVGIEYLAKGYADWALGPKTVEVPRDGLGELADSTVRLCRRWFAAATTSSQPAG